MKKKHIRTVVDMAMIVLLPMLMAYSLIGEKLHEIIGTILFALFIVHHVLNRQWYKAIFNGKYTPRRIFQTVLNFLLLVFMLMQPISGILMSKYLYSSIRIAGSSATARELHLFLAYWGFVFMCLHAGTHMCAPIKKLLARWRRTLPYTIMFDGTCYKLIDGKYLECKLDGGEELFTDVYLGRPYEVDANNFAYEQVRKLYGDSEELRKLFEFWMPKKPVSDEAYSAYYDLIDLKTK